MCIIYLDEKAIICYVGAYCILKLYPRSIYTTKLFHEPFFCVVVLWCVGLFCGAGFAFSPMHSQLMLIQTLVSSKYLFCANIVINLSVVLIPTVFVWFHLPYRCLICVLSFAKGFALGFFLFICLLASAISGWFLCLVLQFSSWITIVPIFDYWVLCFSVDSERLLPLLIRRCFAILSILLFERFVFFPMLVRIF